MNGIFPMPKSRGKCKSVCVVFTKKKPGYKEGIKYCSTCELFLEITDIFCPCCRQKFRVHPTDKRLPEKRMKVAK